MTKVTWIGRDLLDSDSTTNKGNGVDRVFTAPISCKLNNTQKCVGTYSLYFAIHRCVESMQTAKEKKSLLSASSS